MRRTIFISHARGDADNEFALWLGLQLKRLGYDVWLDLLNLRGGESHWSDIEQVIHEQATKFVYVLSDASNATDPRVNGAARELAVAGSLRAAGPADFVVPMAIERLAKPLTIILQGINSIACWRHGWARALADLLEKLEMDGVPRSEVDGAEAVTNWWRERHSARAGVEDRPDPYVSNWFALDALPKSIRFYPLSREQEEIDTSALPFPAFVDSGRLVTFAKEHEVRQALKSSAPLTQLVLGERAGATELATRYFVKYGERTKLRIEPWTAQRHVVRLMRDAWERALPGHGVRPHQMAGQTAYWFPVGFADKDRAYFVAPETETRSWRQLAGRVKGKHWHFAVSGWFQLDPFPLFVVRTHVLFSDDGETIWESDRLLHRARRSACKTWWNDSWRDRLLASMRWLGRDKDNLEIPVSADESLRVSTMPVRFVSPVAYELFGAGEPQMADDPEALAFEAEWDDVGDFDDEIDETED